MHRPGKIREAMVTDDLQPLLVDHCYYYNVIYWPGLGQCGFLNMKGNQPLMSGFKGIG